MLFYMNSCSCCIGFIGGYFEFSVIALEGRNRHFPRSSKVFFVVTMGKSPDIYIYIYNSYNLTQFCQKVRVLLERCHKPSSSTENFLGGWVYISFSRRALIHVAT